MPKLTVLHLPLKITCFVIALLVILLDQWTKQIAVDVLQVPGTQHAFLPYFNFLLSYNEGAAMSLLSDAGGWQRWLFSVIAAVVSVALVIWILILPKRQWLEISALTLILGGAIGNLIDRLVLGKVVDFVDWYYISDQCLPFFAQVGGQCHWPTFNVADVAIMLGAFLLIIDMLFSKKEASRPQG